MPRGFFEQGRRIALMFVGAVSAAAGCADPLPHENVGSTTAALVGPYYVSPFGSGTSCTQLAPCALSQAQQNVRALNRGSGLTNDVYIELLDGTYSGGLYLTNSPSQHINDSGTNGYKIVYEAALNATPILSGGVQLFGWTPTTLNGGPVYMTSLPSSIQTVHSRHLFVNGVRAQRAGGPPPNDLALISTTGLDPYSQKTSFPYNALNYTSAAAIAWSNPTSIEFEINGLETGARWVDSRCPVASISPTGGITMAQPCFGNVSQLKPDEFPSLTQVSHVDNVKEMLTLPGQWYVDFSIADPVVYYKPFPNEDMRTATVIYTTQQEVLDLSGASPEQPLQNLSFTGLTFAYTTFFAPATNTGFAEMQANLTQTFLPFQGKPVGGQGFCGEICASGVHAPCVASAAGWCGNGTVPYAYDWTLPTAAVEVANSSNILFQNNTFTHLGASGLSS